MSEMNSSTVAAEASATAPVKKKGGFASMSPEKQKEIASKGGKAAHAQGTAHRYTKEEAKIHGKAGGIAAHEKGTAHQFTLEKARAAGRAGGIAAAEKNATQKQELLRQIAAAAEANKAAKA